MDDIAIKKARERRSQIEEIIKDDPAAIGLLRSLTFSAVDYVDTTVNYEAHKRKLADSERCIDDSTENMIAIDNEKRKSHEALISKLDSFNRYLFKNYEEKAPIGGIYSLEPPESIRNRHRVGDWVGYFVFGLRNGGESNL